jgi:hypothetical protein
MAKSSLIAGFEFGSVDCQRGADQQSKNEDQQRTIRLKMNEHNDQQNAQFRKLNQDCQNVEGNH